MKLLETPIKKIHITALFGWKAHLEINVIRKINVIQLQTSYRQV